MTLVDAHVHLFPPAQAAERPVLAARDRAFAEMYAAPAARMATYAELERAMAAAGIDRSVAVGFAFSHPTDIAAQNDYLLGRGAREKVAVLATVNPALPGWQREAERALARGARGFGELRPGNQGWAALGAEGRALGEFAANTGAILLWHTSEPAGHAYPGKAGGISPADLLGFAAMFPAVPVVGAHLGGGAPFYLQMPELRAIENIYFDTAAQSLLYDDVSIARTVEMAGSNRVLFASDFPLLSPRRQLERVRSVLDGPAASAVCGENAEGLFFTWNKT